MSKAKARVFVPLTKVDEEQRLVYGTITQEILDKSGEVMDYESSKPLFEEWSNSIHEASGGLSKGNLRVMHGLNVAGKITDLAFNDDEKSIEVCSKVVDDTQWNMVLEGCYTGFSVGGSYAKRWSDNGVKKFTAKPNEVSLVDNPCVPSATFSLVKADGAEEEVAFKVEHDAELWPELAKLDADGMKADDKEEPGVTNDDEDSTDANKKKPKAKKAEKAATNVTVEPTAAQIADKAGELAKAAGDGTTWQDHIEAAREELMKTGATQAYLEQQRQEGKAKDEGSDEEEAEEGTADEGAEDEEAEDDASAGAVEKTTPPGVKQVWTASDGKTFEKKADAEAHEATLAKAAEPKTDAEKLRDRLAKAIEPQPTPEETGLMEDFDRLGKVFDALSTPFGDDGQPKLEKGMYTINRFSSVLSDMASLSRSIKAEGQREGSDTTDSTVSADIIAAVKTLGASFITYAQDQVTELLAGMDDDVIVSYHDYYYCAAQDDGENQLAKDVCSLLVEHKDDSRERRDTLSKAFGYVEATLESTDDEALSPPMQKRFDALEAENTELKKVAGEAVEKVEELAKRMQAIEDTPMPRAPKNIIEKGGEGTFLGKAASTEEEKVAVLQEMLKTHGPDALATMMIKASHATGGQQLRLKSQ